eukprot:2195405-Pyramimonas_sp.AAC.1
MAVDEAAYDETADEDDDWLEEHRRLMESVERQEEEHRLLLEESRRSKYEIELALFRFQCILRSRSPSSPTSFASAPPTPQPDDASPRDTASDRPLAVTPPLWPAKSESTTDLHTPCGSAELDS